MVSSKYQRYTYVHIFKYIFLIIYIKLLYFINLYTHIAVIVFISERSSGAWGEYRTFTNDQR